MEPLIIRNMEHAVCDKLRAIAQSHGCSVEEEILDILRTAVDQVPKPQEKGLGSRIAELFRDQADLGDEPLIVEEWRGDMPKPLRF